jgi:excisionase family DNA binding protein
MATTEVRTWPLLTIHEAASCLAVSEKTIRRLIANRQMPSLRVGKQIRIDARELEAWLHGEDTQPGGSS